MRLARRERYFVFGAALFIALFLLFQFVLLPFFEARRRVTRGVEAKKRGLEEIVRLSSEYRRYQKDAQGVERILAGRERGFTLFSFLEKQAGDADVKKNIKYMKPSVSTGSGPYKESLVEMKLEAVSLQKLTGYLYRIESPEKAVSIKRISIKQNQRKAGSLDAILQVLTFQ